MKKQFTNNALINETLANLRTTPIRSLTVFLATLILALAVFGWNEFEVDQAQKHWDETVYQGGYSWVAESREAKEFEASICENLNQISSVITAGSILETASVTFPQDPTYTRTLFTATPGFISYAWPDAPHRSSSAIGNEIATDFGIATESQLPTGQVQYIAERDSRIAGINDSLVIGTQPSGKVRQCFIEAEPSAAKELAQAIPTYFPSETKILLRDALTRTTLNTNPEQLLNDRASQHAWGFFATILAVLTMIMAWVKRGESSLYRLLGMKSGQLIFMSCIETLLLVIVPISIAFLTLLLFRSSALTSLSLGIHLKTLLTLWLITTLLPLMGSFFARSNKTIDHLKEAAS